MGDISFRAERYWSRQYRGYRWTGFAYDNVGRILVSCGPYRSKDEAVTAIRDLTSVKYGISAAA